MNGIFGVQTLVLAFLTTVASLGIFFLIRLSAQWLCEPLLNRYAFFRSYVDKIRGKSIPFVNRYGLFGLALFVALPIPGAGIYSGALLSWLFNMKWHMALVAVMPAAAISNTIVSLAAVGILNGIKVIAFT